MSDTTQDPNRSSRQSPKSLREAWIALTGLSSIFLFEMLDNSVLNVALPTIGRDLHASTTGLQWVTGAYAVIFGSLMLAFGAIADRFGRRRIMLIGLVLLALASFATAFVTSAGELIAVRGLMGVAAAMTTPGSMALAFRLFQEDKLRVRAITVISTVGLIGLAIGPTVGGLVLRVAPWQLLLLINVPIALLAIAGIRFGIAKDDPSELNNDPIDYLGAALGTITIVFALLSPTLFVDHGASSLLPWATTVAALAGLIGFILRERSAEFPMLNLELVARPLVSSGLAYEAATGIAIAGLGYLITLQMQLDWGWSPAKAAIAMLPQVIVLLAGGPFVEPFVERVGFTSAASLSAFTVVGGLALYALVGTSGYLAVATALVLVSAGLRVVGVVAGTNVMRGLPEDRTSIGAAMTDTATEFASGVGIAIAGTIIAAIFVGEITSSHWTIQQTSQFQHAIRLAGWTLTIIAAALVSWGFLRSRGVEESGFVVIEETVPEFS